MIFLKNDGDRVETNADFSVSATEESAPAETERIEIFPEGLRVVQDGRLYRFTSDSVLLSRFARPKKGDEIADFCAGSGIVAFHFYALNRGAIGGKARFTLFEMQEPLCRLAEKTLRLNALDGFSVVCGRIQDIPAEYREKFSLILCNPPYERGGPENADPAKAICRKELTVTLGEIAAAAAKCLKFGGRLALVNRADRLAEICYTLRAVGLEVKRVQPTSGRAGAKPYLLLIEAVKGGKPGTELLPTLVNG